ncbi:MAG: S8 family serine peptidase [Phycisphaerae bacterium]
MPETVAGWASEYLVVQFTPKVVDAAAARAGSKQTVTERALAQAVSNGLRAAFGRWSVTHISAAYPHEFGDRELAERLGIDRVYLVHVQPDTDLAAMAADLGKYADEIELAGVDRLGGPAQFVPNDPRFSQQYGMHNTGQTGGRIDADIDAPEAWEIHTGEGGTVTIAIIDSGVDPHTEFAGRLVLGINTIPIEDPTLTTDSSGHGTHVAGIAAAEGNNAVGIAGVTWGASIMPVRVISAAGGSTGAVAAEGLVWAADNGADVCNLSLEYFNLDSAAEQFLRGAVDYAHGRGAVVVAAAGNAEGGAVAAPARFRNCIAVSYTDDDDFIGFFSSIGEEVDVCAAGDAVWSTVPGNGYARKTGTSMASPAVSGLAALIKSYAPDLTNDGIRDVLSSTADDLGPPGWDEVYGFGRINAAKALIRAGQPVWIISSFPPDGAVDAGQPFAIGASSPTGWNSIELVFAGDAGELTARDFTVAVEPSSVQVPRIGRVDSNGAMVTLRFNDVLPVGAWTTVWHDESGTGIRVGVLPGDVDGDGTTAASDLLTLIDAYTGVAGTLPDWSTDIDRSGEFDLTDIVRLIDLMTGAGEYNVYLSASLPEQRL